MVVTTGLRVAHGGQVVEILVSPEAASLVEQEGRDQCQNDGHKHKRGEHDGVDLAVRETDRCSRRRGRRRGCDYWSTSRRGRCDGRRPHLWVELLGE